MFAYVDMLYQFLNIVKFLKLSWCAQHRLNKTSKQAAELVQWFKNMEFVYKYFYTIKLLGFKFLKEILQIFFCFFFLKFFGLSFLLFNTLKKKI